MAALSAADMAALSELDMAALSELERQPRGDKATDVFHTDMFERAEEPRRPAAAPGRAVGAPGARD